MSKESIEIARAFVTIVPSMKDAQKTISQELGQAAQEAGKEVGEKIGDEINTSLSDAFGKTGALNSISKLTSQIGEAIGAIGEKAYASAKELDSGYDTIIKKTGATGKQFKDFQDIANNIFGNMPEEMDTVGAAVGEVNTRFKLTGTQLQNTSEQFTKFAKVNGVDVSNSVDDVQNAMAAFNVETKDAGKVLDVLNRTGQNTGADVATRSKKVKENATAFRELGLDIYGSINFMGNLETAGADSATVLSGLKRALKSATEEGKPLSEALAELENTIKNGTDSTDGLSKAYELFGKSGAGVFEAVRNGQISFTDLADSTSILNDAVGTLDSTYEETLDGWDKMTIATNNLKLAGSELTGAFFEAAAPAVDGLTDIVKGLTQGFMDLPPEVQGVIGVIGAVGIEAAKIVPKIIEFSTQLATLKVMKELSGEATGLSGGLGGLKTALTSINPVFIAIAAAVAAAVAVFMTFQEDVKNNTVAVKAFKEETATLYESATSAVAGVNELAQGELSAEKATQGLADAQLRLKNLQDAQAEASQKAAQAQQEQLTSTLDALQGTDVELSTFGNILDGLTNGAYRLAVQADTAKERFEGYGEAAEQAAEASKEAEQAINLATNQVAAYNLLASEMTDIEKQKTEELLNSIDMINTSAETYQKYCDDIAAVNAAHSSTISTLEEVKAGYQQQLGEIEAELQNYQESAKNSLESVFGNFNDIKVEVDKSVTDMINSLNSQIDYMDKYQANLKKAMELGIDDGMVKKLSDGSMESAKILQAIVDDGGKNINEFVTKFNKVEDGKAKFTNEIGEIAYNFSGRMDEIKSKLDTTLQAMNQANTAYQAGMNTMQGYINGMNDKEGVLRATAARLAAIPSQVTRAINEIKSPSRVMMKLGSFIVQGLNEGMVQQIGSVTVTAQLMASSAITTVKSTMSKGIRTAHSSIKKLLRKGSSDYAAAGQKIANTLTNSVNDSIAKESKKIEKTINRSFERYDLDYDKQAKKLQNQINRTQNRISNIRDNSNDSAEVKAQKKARKKELEAEKKQLQKQLDQVKKNADKYKKIQSQFGGNIGKAFTEALTKQAEKVTGQLATKIENYTSKMQKKLETVNGKISDMRSKMSEYGDMLTIEEEGLYGGGIKQHVKIKEPLQEQIKTLKNYANNLKQLKGKIPKSLLTEITEMDIDSAVAYSNELLKMSDSERKAYNKLWKQKQTLAKNTATNFYADEVKSIKDNYTAKIESAFETAKNKIADFGLKSAKGFVKGLKSINVSLEVENITNKMIKNIKQALGIKSPSRVFAEIGEYCIEGAIIGAEDKEKELYKTYENLADIAVEAYNYELQDQLDSQIETEITTRFNTDSAAYVHPVSSYDDTNNKTITAQDQSITVNVYGAQGQDVNALADAVIRRINQKIETRRAAYA